MKKVLIISLAFVFSGFKSGDEIRIIEGFAQDKTTNQFAYKEVHSEVIQNGKHTKTITSFQGKNNKEFARRELDFSQSFQKPKYILNDHRTGLIEEVIYLNRKM